MAPDEGIYKEKPRPESISALITYLRGSKLVADVSPDGEQVIVIKKTNGTEIRVYLTNLYIVGIADVVDIIARNKGLNSIVTMSEWNSYSEEAKSHCKQQGVGLFRFKEILGAVWYDGQKFLDYTPPKKDK